MVNNMTKNSVVNIDTVFNIINGISSSEVTISPKANKQTDIPYFRPSSKYMNVIAGYIDKDLINSKFIFPPETLFVSTDGQGSHTYSYVSTCTFIPNSNVIVLIPKIPLSLQEKMYYSMCITINRYKFNYGRKPKGNRFASLKIPKKDDIPTWVNEIQTNDCSKIQLLVIQEEN